MRIWTSTVAIKYELRHGKVYSEVRAKFCWQVESKPFLTIGNRLFLLCVDSDSLSKPPHDQGLLHASIWGPSRFLRVASGRDMIGGDCVFTAGTVG